MKTGLFKKARKKANLSQENTAKLLDTNVNTVKKLENEEVGHQAYWIRKKAINLFGIPDSKLFPDEKKS